MPQAELCLLLDQQKRWAERRELDLDEEGYTSKIEENLFGSPSPETRSDLERARASGISTLTAECAEGAGGKPGEFQRVHSTAALVCNVFDYWRARGVEEIAGLCRADPGCEELSFSQDQPTGIEGLSSWSDVLFAGDSAPPTALVASFCEPYAGRPESRLPASVEKPGVWGALADCRDLALGLRANPGRFRMLPVRRLLEQSLGLTARYGVRGFRLLYLWYEVPGQLARLQHREVDRFRMRVGGEVAFEACTWQQLFRAIESRREAHASYVDYLSSRYFPI